MKKVTRNIGRFVSSGLLIGSCYAVYWGGETGAPVYESLENRTYKTESGKEELESRLQDCRLAHYGGLVGAMISVAGLVVYFDTRRENENE